MLDWADEFWMKTKGMMFPDVEQEYREMLQKYATVKKEMTSEKAELQDVGKL